MPTARSAPRRLTVRIPFTYRADLSFGITLHSRRRTRGRARPFRDWSRAVGRCALLVLNALLPLAIVLLSPDLARLGQAVLAAPGDLDAPRPIAFAQRPVVESRRTLVTVTSADPPHVRAHVVAAGETLLSIAASYGVAPQTVAYNNNITDSRTVRVGQSLLIPPFDAAIIATGPGETIDVLAARFGVDASTLRMLNRIGTDDATADDSGVVLVPVGDGRFPGFRLHLSEPPRVLAPRLRWPTAGVITQLYSAAHPGVDIAAPYGSPVVATGGGTVSSVGWRGTGGLAVCVYHDIGLETCAYHTSAVYVEAGERVATGQSIAAVGSSGTSTGPHVHWEARTNGALIDPLTYAPVMAAPLGGGATGAP